MISERPDCIHSFPMERRAAGAILSTSRKVVSSQASPRAQGAKMPVQLQPCVGPLFSTAGSSCHGCPLQPVLDLVDQVNDLVST